MQKIDNQKNFNMKNEEHNLQVACVRWFDMQYPKHKNQLFAVPNGGQRNVVVALKLKAEGVRAGVADLILMCGLGQVIFIEMKTKKGTQTKSQKHLKRCASKTGIFMKLPAALKTLKN